MSKEDKAHLGRPPLKETQGEENVKVTVYIPKSVKEALTKEGKSRPKEMSPGAVLAELACKEYG